MNQSEQMNEALGIESTDEAANLNKRLNDMVAKSSLSVVLSQLGAIASRGVKTQGEGPGQTIQNYGKAVPATIHKASDQAQRMEKRG